MSATNSKPRSGRNNQDGSSVFAEEKAIGRPPVLTREAVLDAACDLARSQGLDFPMRTLSKELGVSTMATYRYFKNREALEAAIIDCALGEILERLEAIRTEIEPSQWREVFRRSSLANFEILCTYPGVANKLMLGALQSENGLRLVEAQVGFFVELGLEERRAAAIFQTVGLFIAEAASLEDARAQGKGDIEGLLEGAQAMEQKYPRAASYIAFFADVSVRDRLILGIDFFAQAIEAELDRLD